MSLPGPVKRPVVLESANSHGIATMECRESCELPLASLYMQTMHHVKTRPDASPCITGFPLPFCAHKIMLIISWPRGLDSYSDHLMIRVEASVAAFLQPCFWPTWQLAPIWMGLISILLFVPGLASPSLI